MSKRAESIASVRPGKVREKTVWTGHRTREAMAGYLFLLPNFIGMIVFLAIPLLVSLWYSFTNADTAVPAKAQFVGLESYSYALQDDTFKQASLQTVGYLLGFLPLSIIPALFLAVLLNAKMPGRSIFRTAYFLPVVASVVGVALIWRWLFQYDFGPINTILGFIGLGKVHWLESPQTAMFTVIVVSAWQAIGYNIVLFLAGLQAIPRSLYEAAEVDGANTWTQFRRITLPLLTPATFFVVITSLIKGLQEFAVPYTMFSKGGPANSAMTAVFALYNEAFPFLHTGRASAMAWLLFVVIFVVTLIQFKIGNRWVNYD
ncbi:MAG: sugar ABC transporter permease [Chloroflexia bacterium]